MAHFWYSERSKKHKIFPTRPWQISFLPPAASGPERVWCRLDHLRASQRPWSWTKLDKNHETDFLSSLLLGFRFLVRIFHRFFLFVAVFVLLLAVNYTELIALYFTAWCSCYCFWLLVHSVGAETNGKVNPTNGSLPTVWSGGSSNANRTPNQSDRCATAPSMYICRQQIVSLIRNCLCSDWALDWVFGVS